MEKRKKLSTDTHTDTCFGYYIIRITPDFSERYFATFATFFKESATLCSRKV